MTTSSIASISAVSMTAWASKKKDKERSDGKTELRTIVDDIRKLSAEQCIERRAEVDAVLEAAR